MTEHTDHPTTDDSIHDGRGSYDVVLLVEQAITPGDAKRVRSLHAEIEDPVVYHVLLPLEDAAARIEASLGTLGAGDLMAAPALAMNDVDIEALRRECEEQSSSDLQQTLVALRDADGTAHGKITSEPPVDALAALVRSVDAREAIILTRPHVVAEFFHVDWTSRARRKLGVPVLHLIEHENFDEQSSGSGEGVSGL
ncbi:hypothetical protein [Nocardioides sp. zg-1228]|uniref:hypothetical protein n=1 Tax=Nocardioides sp. zg-1228 TaxID=2763008 RepID=UPI001643617A|nr:hypothetical protein [Nocardioides sp. zg-1228]MBC2931443.1 hypothetical protein [Nocardioides sp. zg-1228]QSF57056.1 hypothetical protein JX575_15980 [Nocardioides sp. zg-1228]